jgi:hypothetical protein
VTRQALIERILRHVYGEQPTDDSNITANLVNLWINDGIGLAAKQNAKDSLAIDGITYVNNSFYTTFKNLAIAPYEQFSYQVTLPQIPFGIGKNEGISSLTIVDSTGNISYDVLMLSENQISYYRAMPKIPNKILGYPEGTFVYILSTLLLNIGYTARVKMISGGDSTNLNSVLNVPDDFVPVIFDYCAKMLLAERLVPKDIANDGIDKA